MGITQVYGKELVALVIFLSVVIFTLYMAVKKKIDAKLTSIFLAFSLPIGIVISNYDLVKKLKWMGFDLETFEKGVTTIKENALEEIRTEVENHRGSINLLIRDADKARVDLNKVEELSREAKTKVDEIGGVLEKANEAMVSIRSISDFSLILIKASNDDRSAFDKLLDIYHASNNPLSKIAYNAILKIIDDLIIELDVSIVKHKILWDKTNIDPNTSSLQIFELALNSDKVSFFYKPELLENIWGQNRFKEGEKLTFIFNIIKTTTSLRTLYRACTTVESVAKLEKNLVDYTAYIEWWEKNKDLYKSK